MNSSSEKRRVMVDNDRRWRVVVTWMMMMVMVVVVSSDATISTDDSFLTTPLTAATTPTPLPSAITHQQPPPPPPPPSPPPPPPPTTTTTTTATTTTTTTTTTTPTTPPPLPPKPTKPHVILIVADDLGWNDVSWHNPKVVTPHLGALAKGGVILNQSYVLPTCTPTRAALLTGRYPFTIGMQKGALNPLEPRGLPLKTRILPQALKKNGYSTHIIGKWHLGFCSWRYTPTRRGFDTFYGFYTGSEDYYTHRRTEKKITKLTRKKNNEKGALDLRNNTTPDDTKNGVYSTYLFASVAEDLLRSRNPKKPMFLYLPFQSVHAPLQVPKNYTRAFSRVKDYYRRNYLGMVMAMDDAVGRVVASLKATGHYDNSIIIFTTDNGGSVRIGASNYPLRGGKSNLLEGGTRGPAFIHSPLLPNPGSVFNQLFHVTDWFSTIVELAGGTTPGALDGYDQWYALAGLSDSPRKKFIYNIDNTDGKFRAALRMNDFKLSVGYVGRKEWAPMYPERFRFRKPRTEYYPLPGDCSNNTEMNENLSLNPITSSSWRNRESSNLGNDTYMFTLQKDNSTFTGFHLDGRHFTASEEDHTKSLNEIQYNLDRSPRLLDPFTAIFGRNSHKKKNKRKEKQNKKKPNKTSNKNEQNVKKPKKTNNKKQQNKKPNKTKNKGVQYWNPNKTNNKKQQNKKPNKTSNTNNKKQQNKKSHKTNNKGVQNWNPNKTNNKKQQNKKPNETNIKDEQNIKKSNNKVAQNVKKPNKTNNKKKQNKKPNETNNKDEQNIKKPNNKVAQNVKKPNKTNNKIQQNQKPNKTKKKDKNKDRPKKVKKKKKPNSDKENVSNRNKRKGFVKWWRLRFHSRIDWDRYVLRRLNRYLSDGTKIRLYNITADPGETTDLSLTMLPKTQTMLNHLAYQLYRYVPPKGKWKSSRGHPDKWDKVWTPGWCIAK